MKEKKNKETEPSEFITKRQATILLGFKNNRPIPELIKQGYLKTYSVKGSAREMLKREDVLNLPKKDPTTI